MARQPPSRRGLLITAVLIAAFVAWTVLVTSTDVIAHLDRQLLAPRIDALSVPGQILGTIAMLTWPVLVLGALVVVAIWAVRRRMRNLAAALALTALLAGLVPTVLRRLVRRDRPDQLVDIITTAGFSYPSGHMTAITAASVMVTAIFTVTRQPGSVRRWWAVGRTALVLVVALNRWALSAHWVSDIIGGLLLGAACAAVALIVADVHVLPRDWRELVGIDPTPPKRIPDDAPRCAVIYNPAKVTDWMTFRRVVEFELARRGYRRTLWLETTVEDPGRTQARLAIDAGVDLVIGAGGDGTIRTVSSELAGSGIPFGLVAAGTGNLLARNLGVPLDETEAVRVALDGHTAAIDLVRITVDDGTPEHFAVMAGIGIDAAILGGTDDHLKKAVGSAAYFVSAAQHVNHPPMEAKIRVDDGPQFRRRALVMVVGNVGFLQGGIPLLPDARADDGVLDLLVASPRTWRDKVSLTAKVLARKDRSNEQLDRITAQKVEITIAEPEDYQLDGDTIGSCRRVVFEVVPGALALRMPSPEQAAVGEIPEAAAEIQRAAAEADRHGMAD